MMQKRQLFRIRIHRVGQVRRRSDVAKCEVLDLTERGICLSTTLTVTTGEELEVQFDLTSTCAIRCTVLVMYVAPSLLGALITEISPEHKAHLAKFIDQLIATNLAGF
ncbi:MAG: PilZ domain-containing protein [Nitrospiraceae bacterium]